MSDTEPESQVLQEGDPGRELTDELSRALGDLGRGLEGIRERVELAIAELRRGVAPPALAVAMEGLHDFFALLSQVGESFEDHALPELDRFDADVQRSVEALDRAVDAGPDLALVADRLETQLLAALGRWPAVTAELERALLSLDASPGAAA